MMRVARLRDRLSAGLTKPEAGNNPNSTENSRISNIPNQKFGIERPHNAAIVAMWSTREPFLTAERMPSGTPSNSANRKANTASSAVTGNFSITRSSTGRLMRINSPRSPSNSPCTQSR